MDSDNSRLQLGADELLSTTRAVRKRLDFDRPLDQETLLECLEIALRAPSGSNSQHWQFVLVDDRDKIGVIAQYYRRAFAYNERRPANPLAMHGDDPAMRATQERVLSSAQYLAANLYRVPALLPSGPSNKYR